jgi:hypothetical protein
MEWRMEWRMEASEPRLLECSPAMPQRQVREPHASDETLGLDPEEHPVLVCPSFGGQRDTNTAWFDPSFTISVFLCIVSPTCQ